MEWYLFKHRGNFTFTSSWSSQKQIRKTHDNGLYVYMNHDKIADLELEKDSNAEGISSFCP